ncbi:hypothetical protein [Microbacterium lushaniae]|uniref:hypothetical protein n=1 Tax=Microbacterium lushaniae TaxID=2614639 RepID=UPI0017861570|nr:hypothetical protein [Microbacterium lushaniae]
MYSSQEPWRRPVDIPHRPPLRHRIAIEREWARALVDDDDEPPPVAPRHPLVM